MSERVRETLKSFYKDYQEAAKKSKTPDMLAKQLFEQLCALIEVQLKDPYQFPPYHEAITAPFDYYRFGLEFIRPAIDFEHSTLQGKEELKRITACLEKKENVILFANHQTEIDPQIISLLLEPEFPKLAQEMIFVAGHRVVSDPSAIPMSLGRNLLCIYSKKYIDHPPEKKAEKLAHNQRTMKMMLELLKEGGKCIYVAPSGGRDRTDSTGHACVAPFDPDSIEMFSLVAKKSGRPVHFQTLTLATYALLPPPKGVNIEIGEKRTIAFAPVHLAFGPEIEMQAVANEGIDKEVLDKKEKRKQRADLIWQYVNDIYEQF